MASSSQTFAAQPSFTLTGRRGLIDAPSSPHRRLHTRIEATVTTLTTKGVEFLRFSFFQQDTLGIWTAPNGNKVAWFKDPDGNTLSLSKH